MNKELEALQEVRQQLIYYKEYAKEKLPTKVKQIDDSCEEELNLIETALKDYEELTSKPAILCGRTQAIIDTICKNYKEVKITNLIDEKKVKAFEIIKAHPEQLLDIIGTDNYNEYLDLDYAPNQYMSEENYYSLKEALL